MEASSRAALVAGARAPGRAGRRRADGPALLDARPTSCSPSPRLLDGQPRCAGRWPTRRARPTTGRRWPSRLFGGKVADAALELVETVARQRWSRPSTWSSASRRWPTRPSLAAADARRRARRRRGRAVPLRPDRRRRPRARHASSATARPRREGKAALLDRLLGGKVSPVTEQLLRNVLTGPHVGHAETAVERLLRGRPAAGAASRSPA